MARTFNANFDTKELEALGDRLGRLNVDTLNKATINAVNQVTDRAYNNSRRAMNRKINLDDEYITRRMTVQKAAQNGYLISSSITAPGDLTKLGQFNPQIKLIPVKHPSRSKGNPALGIPAGLKAGGVTVEVSRGSPRTIAHGFILPLRRGNVSGGNGQNVFTRDLNGKISSRYGPSVYQLFRVTLDDTIDEIADDLENSVGTVIQTEVNSIL